MYLQNMMNSLRKLSIAYIWLDNDAPVSCNGGFNDNDVCIFRICMDDVYDEYEYFVKKYVSREYT